MQDTNYEICYVMLNSKETAICLIAVISVEFPDNNRMHDVWRMVPHWYLH